MRSADFTSGSLLSGFSYSSFGDKIKSGALKTSVVAELFFWVVRLLQFDDMIGKRYHKKNQKKQKKNTNVILNISSNFLPESFNAVSF